MRRKNQSFIVDLRYQCFYEISEEAQYYPGTTNQKINMITEYNKATGNILVSLVRICVVVGFIIYGVAVTIYCDIKAKKFKGLNLNSVSVYMPKEYYSEPDYHSNGLFVIDNSQCFVIAIDFDNVSEKDKEVCDFISWDKVDYLYKAKNEGDVAYAIQLLSPMFSYHRYIGKVNKHTLMKYLYYGDNNGPGQIVYYTTSDPETHVLYAIFDHDKDKVFTKKDNENILGCIITRHK